MQRNGGIGIGGRLPWRLSSDLRNFKRLTLGHHLIQGRRTWESIGRPLAGRTMVVVTRSPGYKAAGCTVVESLRAAVRLAEQAGETEAFIGGGARLFAEAMPLAERIYLTRVDAELEVDTFFPPIDPDGWAILETWSHPADQQNDHPFIFEVLGRIHPTVTSQK